MPRGKFVRFGIQRPGEPFAPSPRSGRELFAGTLISRWQLLLRATADAVEVENLGKCAMLVNGEEKTAAILNTVDAWVMIVPHQGRKQIP